MKLGYLTNALSDDSHDFQWLDIAFILAIALLIIGAGIGLRDPWPADEPRFAAIARDMVHSGEWFFPRIGGVYYPDKPPVFFWIMASFYKLTGSLRISFLLPSLFASLGVLILVYDLGRRLWNRGTGLSAALLLLFTVQFTSSAKVAQIDMLLCFWITLSIYGLTRHLLSGPAWLWYALGFIAAGMGVITKGVGFLSLLIFIPYLFAVATEWNTVYRSWNWRWLIGPILFVGTISIWLLPMLLYVQNSADPALEIYRDNILFKQTGGRYLHARAHLEPVWYYLSNVIPAMWLPLSLLLPWLIPAWIKAIRLKDQRVFLLFVWIICVLLFFSLSSGKRGVYLLSILPIVALLVAPCLQSILQRVSVQRLLFVTLLALGMAILLACLYLTVLQPEKGAQLVSKYQITPWPPLISIGVLALLITLGFKVQRSYAGWLGFLSCFWLVYSLWVYPAITDTRSGSDFVQKILRQLAPEQELALVGWKEQFLLYLDQPVKHFGFRRHHEQPIAIANKQLALPASLEAVNWLGQQSNRVILISEKRIANCFIARQSKIAGYANRESWYLLNFDDVNPDCVIESPDIKALTYDPRAGRLLPY